MENFVQTFGKTNQFRGKFDLFSVFIGAKRRRQFWIPWISHQKTMFLHKYKTHPWGPWKFDPNIKALDTGGGGDACPLNSAAPIPRTDGPSIMLMQLSFKYYCFNDLYFSFSRVKNIKNLFLPPGDWLSLEIKNNRKNSGILTKNPGAEKIPRKIIHKPRVIFQKGKKSETARERKHKSRTFFGIIGKKWKIRPIKKWQWAWGKHKKAGGKQGGKDFRPNGEKHWGTTVNTTKISSPCLKMVKQVEMG